MHELTFIVIKRLDMVFGVVFEAMIATFFLFSDVVGDLNRCCCIAPGQLPSRTGTRLTRDFNFLKWNVRLSGSLIDYPRHGPLH